MNKTTTAQGNDQFYTVMISRDTHGNKVPYTVRAQSDYHAARIVRAETGYRAAQQDVEGPFCRF